MRILVLNYEWPPVGGGGGVAAAELARQWARDHEVDCVTSHAGPLPFREEDAGVTIYRVSMPARRRPGAASMAFLLAFPIAALPTALSLIKRRSYDVINTHFAIPTGPLGTVASASSGVPNVLSVHGGDVYDPTKPYSPHRFWAAGTAVRLVLARASAIVAQSSDTATRVLKHYGSDLRSKLSVIPLPFTPPPTEWLSGSKAAVRRELGMEASAFYLVSVGRFVARKGFDRLIDAMSCLPEAVRLVLVGTGPLADELIRQTRQARLERRVSLVGHVDERTKYRYLTAADCYVLSSYHEGFGIVLQEAMAAGLAIVSTKEGGQTDLLQDGVNAVLMESNDPEIMARAVNRLMENNPLREALGRTNAREVLSYRAAAMGAEYVGLFEEAIRRRRATARSATA